MLYSKYLGMHIKSSFEYRKNMIFVVISQVIMNIAEILSIYILFQKFETVGYWGFYETALMFGIITTVYSFTECFACGFDDFSKLVKTGEYDRLLVRPVGVFYQIFCSKMEFSKLCKVAMGIIISIIALCNLSVTWTIFKIVVFVLMFVCGCVVLFGTLLIKAGTSIFTIDDLECMNIITNGCRDICYYPLNIYSKWLSRVFTFIIPLACFNYLPINYIMGYGNVPMWLCAISPLLGMLFIIPCTIYFKWCLSKYQSTGN